MDKGDEKLRARYDTIRCTGEKSKTELEEGGKICPLRYGKREREGKRSG